MRCFVIPIILIGVCLGSSCKKILCPEQTGKQISCDMCHTCLDIKSRFCYTSDHKSCGCATTVPSVCGKGSVNYTFCLLLDDVSLPPPVTTVIDEHSVRNQNKCLLRIRVQMPKLDYAGNDNYYYDDRSPLESQFSREIFGKSSNVSFWNEVTMNRIIDLDNGSISFSTILKSARTDFEL
ncbi:unnamed protein product [Caenorhabditis sp. 36 PRJEB53466]|nr:unnamed protein product [Caenorhabditis sp. 36 PRJEB53466]